MSGLDGFFAFAQRWDDMAHTPEVIYGAIEDTADKFVDINKQQLLDGIGSDGRPLNDLNPSFTRPGMRELYKPYKESINPRAGGRYDMHFSGASFESMRLKIDTGRYSIVGAGWANRYNEGRVDFAANLRGRIFGVFDNDYMRHYKIQYLYPRIAERMRNFLGI